MAAASRCTIRPVQLPILIGVIHLPALPSSPLAAMPLDDIVRLAATEAAALQQAGFNALILENFGDFPTDVPPLVTACMTACAREVRRAATIPLGINVLRNDPRAALAVAVASHADFIRVNVHCSARLTDQGWIDGQAHNTVRERRALGADRIALYCDVDVKHAAPIAARDIGDEAEELAERAMADAVLVTGAGTGKSVRSDDLRKVRARVKVPVLAASGVTVESMGETLAACDGVIIGSAIRKGGRAGAELDGERVAAIAQTFARVANRSVGA
jgi:membrane complex biogenesis BtpA family protein